MNRSYILKKLAARQQYVPPEVEALRAQKELEDLREYLSPEAKAVRDGQRQLAARKTLSELTELNAPPPSKLRSFYKAVGRPALGILGSTALGIATPLVTDKIRRSLEPKPSFLQEMIGKGSLGRKALGVGLLAAGIGGGIKGTEYLYDKIKTPMEKTQYKKKMLSFSPELKREDKRAVDSIFNTLYKFNPKMASDPLVASSFMKRSLQFKDEGIQAMDVKTLTEAARNLAQSKPRSQGVLSEAFPTAASSLMGFA